MGQVRIAIVGVGNCASSLIQGLAYYRQQRESNGNDWTGLRHPELGGYWPDQLKVVAAFDIDERKVGKPLAEAIFQPPNCTKTIYEGVEPNGVHVNMGPVLDGVSDHMAAYPEARAFRVSQADPDDVVKTLTGTGAEVLLNYVPVGSQQATEFYARCCLEAGVSMINCVPVFIASNPEWAEKFRAAGIPIVGDDIKAQLGATIVHRTLTRLFRDRGVRLDATYQLNTGGNTDFLNMLNQTRLVSKRVSKTEAVQSQLDTPLDPDQIHIGPSDYVPWQNDNKVCFLRMEGRGFGGVPLNIELRLSVEDSPNSAGVAIDAVRCCKLARDRGVAGPLTSISSYTMKHPPQQFPDDVARDNVDRFIAGDLER